MLIPSAHPVGARKRSVTKFFNYPIGAIDRVQRSRRVALPLMQNRALFEGATAACKAERHPMYIDQPRLITKQHRRWNARHFSAEKFNAALVLVQSLIIV